jgi:hypothetical protein
MAECGKLPGAWRRGECGVDIFAPAHEKLLGLHLIDDFLLLCLAQ